LLLDFGGGGFNVDADEHVEEFDLNFQGRTKNFKKNFIYLFKLVFTDDDGGVVINSSFFY
jgi:hypothetical protein